jgi:hypothetical protein
MNSPVLRAPRPVMRDENTCSAKATACQPAGPIKVAIIEIEGALNQLHDMISRAESIFEPVLNATSDGCEKACGETPEPSCPQLRDLNHILRGVNRAAERLGALADRSAL